VQAQTPCSGVFGRAGSFFVPGEFFRFDGRWRRTRLLVERCLKMLKNGDGSKR